MEEVPGQALMIHFNPRQGTLLVRRTADYPCRHHKV